MPQGATVRRRRLVRNAAQRDEAPLNPQLCDNPSVGKPCKRSENMKPHDETPIDRALRQMASGSMPHRDIERLAGAIGPRDAVRLLETAAESAEPGVIDALYGAFGAFEFESSALCRAISCGNEGTAVSLAGHGATLEPVLRSIDAGNHPEASDADASPRLAAYLRENLSERTMFHDTSTDRLSTRCEADVAGIVYRMALKPSPRLDGRERRDLTTPARVIGRLADCSLLCSRDLLGLSLAAAIAGEVGLAVRLSGLVPADHPPVAVEVFVPGSNERVVLNEVSDLIYPGCSVECAQVALTRPSSEVSARWTPRLLNGSPEVVRRMVRKMMPGPDAPVASAGRLLVFLASHNFVDEMMVLSSWPRPSSDEAFSAESMTEAIKAAADNGHADAAAWLLSERARRHGSGDLVDLAL